jgi:hypothetical protein
MIREALDALFLPGQVIEIRALRVDGKKNNTASGYFDDFDLATEAAERFEVRCSGVYVTLNEVNPALLSRRQNRIETYADLTTSDHDIIRRRWLPIDFDAVRPAGVSATDAEHDAALKSARRALEELRGEGWPEPLIGDSGNGAHLLYPIDMPNDAESLTVVEKTLASLSDQFGDDLVKVDTKNANAARIWKLYGTIARKGDSTADRPHRRSRLLEVIE